jgi:hypothetical protein
MRKLAGAGRTSYAIAQLLNKKRVRTPRGGRWTDEHVARVLRDASIEVRVAPRMTDARPQESTR